MSLFDRLAFKAKYQFKKFFRNKIEPGKGVKPMSDFEFNPLLKYPRNETCYCGSSKKFKKCCLPNELKAIPASAAPLASSLVAVVRNKKTNG